MADSAVGLLVCDHVSPELRERFGDYPDMFSDLLQPHGVVLEAFDVTSDELPRSPDQCEAWIITGSRCSVYDDEPWIEMLRGFVRDVAERDRRCVGICFGHQMLAHALGGVVKRSDRGWGVGVKSVEIYAHREWMVPRASSYRVLNSHADQVERPPSGSTVLAGNEHCPVAMLEVGPRLLGIQGHPEFTTGYAEALLQRRRGNIIPEGVADAGMDSLAVSPNGELLATWISAFLRDESR